MPLAAPNFDKMFQDGARYPWRATRTAVVFVHQGGDLTMPSGQVTACDPFIGLEFIEHAEPFTVAVPPGRYPVEVSLVGWTKEGEPDGPAEPERVAAAKLVISRETPVRWQMALVGDQDEADLADNEFYGYGVDAGTGCFADYASVPALHELVEEHDDRPGDNRLTDALEAAEWREPVNLTTADGASDLVAFMSGPGDGAYPTWIGFDVADRPACFITDFEILRHA